MAQRKNPGGAPHTLTPEKLDLLIITIEEQRPRSIRDLAVKAKLPHRSVDRWYNTGETDYENDINSPCAQLWHKFEHKKLEIKYERLLKLEKSKKVQATIWLLENEYKAEYGKDSEFVKEILDNVNKLAARKRKTDGE